jgi:hypothetical protein
MEILWQLAPGLGLGLAVGAMVLGGLWLYYRHNHATQTARRR